jgi:anti-sigma B factor antagonist/stage II sporulation protein AA (anti-sigma F factor antagonist)
MRSDQRGRRDEPVIEVSTNGDATVVRLGGELDMATTGPVRRALLDAADGASGRVVVDLAEVEFMDSTALAILLEARARLHGNDRFLLAAPGLEARRALEVSGLDRHFRVCATVEDALAATL